MKAKKDLVKRKENTLPADEKKISSDLLKSSENKCDSCQTKRSLTRVFPK